MQSQRDELVAPLSMADAEKLSGPEAMANVMLLNRLSGPALAVARHAFATALRSTWTMYASVGGVGLLASAFTKRTRIEHNTCGGKNGLSTRRGRGDSSHSHRWTIL